MVTADISGINCGADCSETYDQGTTVPDSDASKRISVGRMVTHRVHSSLPDGAFRGTRHRPYLSSDPNSLPEDLYLGLGIGTTATSSTYFIQSAP